jgi:hypothetical protein
MKKTIFIFLVLSLNSCKKDPQKNPSMPSMDGTYSGLLTSVTYVAFTGKTSIDTLDANFKIDLLYLDGNKTLQLNSTNALLDSLLLNKIEVSDPTNQHYGNDKAYELTLTNPDWRYYYVHYNHIVEKDSIYLKTYKAPGSGWNQSVVFTGVK